MIVADLIRLLETCDPQAVVLIPGDAGLGGHAEMLADVIPVPASVFAGGPAAAHGAVRLAGITAATVVLAAGLDSGRQGNA